MHVAEHSVSIETATGGAFTGYTASDVRGRLSSVAYVRDGSSPVDSSAALTITTERTGQTILALSAIGGASFVRYPLTAAHDAADGTALLFAPGGEAVAVPILVAGERIKVAITAGDDAKVGELVFTVEGT